MTKGTKRKWLLRILSGALLLAAVAGYLLSTPELIPVANATEYRSLAQLVTEQKSAGYVRIGLFGNSWPAHLVETLEGEGTLRFIRSDGTPHVYRKFDGYRLKAMRLRGKNAQEVILVLRSTRKAGGEEIAPTSAPVDDWEREMQLIREARAREEER